MYEITLLRGGRRIFGGETRTWIFTANQTTLVPTTEGGLIDSVRRQNVTAKAGGYKPMWQIDKDTDQQGLPAKWQYKPMVEVRQLAVLYGVAGAADVSLFPDKVSLIAGLKTLIASGLLSDPDDKSEPVQDETIEKFPEAAESEAADKGKDEPVEKLVGSRKSDKWKKPRYQK